MSKGIVLIPTYNEYENISELVKEIFRIKDDLDIFVIDDNSPDNTAEAVRKLKSGNQRVSLISREKKEGLGAAYIEGISKAIEKDKYDYIIMMDSDFSHNPEYIPEMITWLNNYDVVIGSRYIKGGGIRNWSFFRKDLSFLANLSLRIFLGIKVKDSTSGFRCIKTDIMKKINYKSIKSQGYSFLYEMLWRFEKTGVKIKEIPIIFIDRRFGNSKISKTEIIKAILTLVRLSLFHN